MFKINQIEALSRKVAPVFRVQLLSTAAQAKIDDRIQSFRTNETNPLQHGKEHLGRYYTMKEDVKKQLFSHGGFPKSFSTHIKTLTETCLMVRKPFIDIVECVKVLNFDKPVVRFVMYGPKGNGKSLTLAHLIHYAYEDGYLIVHVPWVGEWMRRCKEPSASETREGFTNLNMEAAAWLLHFKTQNAKLLKNPEFKLSQEYIWGKRESTPKDAPFLEMIDHGINRVKYASEVVVALAAEIKKLSNQKVCKTFVAIDGFNAFFYPHTRILTEKKEVVHPSKVTLTEAFASLSNFDWKNGVVVVTVDEIAIAEKDQISHMPKYLLTKEGFEHMDPFVPIYVPEFSTTEITSCLDYFRERKWIRAGKEHDEELAQLSARNPYNLMLLTGSL